MRWSLVRWTLTLWALALCLPLPQRGVAPATPGSPGLVERAPPPLPHLQAHAPAPLRSLPTARPDILPSAPVSPGIPVSSTAGTGDTTTGQSRPAHTPTYQATGPPPGH